jgi:glycosyltransferase involved in cell wall biosynthesis
MKDVLIIGMVDSIHTFHWIERIADGDLRIDLLASRKYRRIQPDLRELLDRQENVKLLRKFPNTRLSPYQDYLSSLILRIFRKDRSQVLKKIIKARKYDYIHALEIQHAGYTLLGALEEIQNNSQLIVTNWGSDIYYFSQFPAHEKKIRRLLQHVDKYSAECSRDYDLATELGFRGNFMEVIPNSYSFTPPKINSMRSSSRTQVIGKCYGGQFGLGRIVIECLEAVLRINEEIQIFLYSVTQDLESTVEELVNKFPGRVRYAGIKDSLSHESLLEEFANSRVYIGASRSDGISTSFLEAMSQGAYPIQTNTSCASEWILKGCIGSVVGTSTAEILEAIMISIEDDALVDQAQIQNSKVLQINTDPQHLSEIAKSFYA